MQSGRRPTRQDVSLLIGTGSDGSTPTPFGRARNLSPTGVFLETEERPPVGSVQEIAVVWGTDVVWCRVRIARHAEDGVGLAFLDPDPTFLAAIREILGENPDDHTA